MIRLFFFIIMLSFSVTTFAQDSTVVAADVIDDCGMDGDDVIPFDATICQDDKAWAIMSSMLPGIYEDIAEMLGLDVATVSDNPDITLGVSSILVDLYNFMFDVCMYVMAIVLGLYVIDLLSKSLRSGRFMRYQGFSAGKMAAGGIAGAGLLLPYQTMYLGQVFIFSISLASPGLTNMAHSAFVSMQQSQFASTQAATLTQATNDSGDNVYIRHEYQAREFYSYLAYMEMCRRLSSAEALTETLRAGESVTEQWDCLRGQTNTLTTDDDVPSILRPASNPSSRVALHDNSYAVLSRLEFGWRLNQYEQCQALDSVIGSYSCGGISFSTVNWEESPYTRLVGGDVLKEILDGINEQIGTNRDATQIANIAEFGWERIYNKIITDAVEAADLTTASSTLLNVDAANEAFENEKKREALEQIYRSRNQDILKKFAAMYYRTVMNALYIGHVFADEEGKFDNVPMEQMRYHYDVASNLTDSLETLFCIQANDSVGDTEAAKRLVESDGVNASSGHFRCLRRDDLSIVGADKRGATETSEAYTERLMELTQAAKEQYKKDMDVAADNLAKQRVAVESSYISTIGSFEEPNLAKKMRQEGFLSLAHYSFMMSEMYEDTRDGVRYIVNHYELQPNQMTEYGVSLDVLDAFASDLPDYTMTSVNNLINEVQSSIEADPIIIPVK